MASERVVVIGAGIGGLTAALLLAARGIEVTVLERAATPGGKLREVIAGGSRLDAGPTVLTMRGVFEEIFAAAGETLAAHLTLHPARTLARHAWSERERLDLFADRGESADAIGSFAGAAEARGFLQFCERASRIHRTLDAPFMRQPAPSMTSLWRGAALVDLLGINPFATLWSALGEHFRDPRLRQLFGRYATYCGASPTLAAATLMLVADVEAQGVWLVEGGMHRIATVIADLAVRRGATLRHAAEVSEIVVTGGRAAGVVLADGERIEARAVLCNADVAALSGGLFGAAARDAVAPTPARMRSFSAMTWALVAEAQGFALLRHNVFFSRDYLREFDDLAQGHMPRAPTVYVCAQDRSDQAGLDKAGPDKAGPERLFCILNAPPRGDRTTMTAMEIEQCQHQLLAQLQRCGLTVRPDPERCVVTTPTDFARLFPATGGALYGRASHGWRASFQRPGVRSRLPGLYLAGGSTHPGPGLPMAALSGRMAASCLLSDLAPADRASSRRSPATAMPGGMSMRSATTGSTPSR